MMTKSKKAACPHFFAYPCWPLCHAGSPDIFHLYNVGCYLFDFFKRRGDKKRGRRQLFEGETAASYREWEWVEFEGLICL
jgi:hypothetical protein